MKCCKSKIQYNFSLSISNGWKFSSSLNLCNTVSEHQTLDLMRIIVAGLKCNKNSDPNAVECRALASIVFAYLVPRVQVRPAWSLLRILNSYTNLNEIVVSINLIISRVLFIYWFLIVFLSKKKFSSIKPNLERLTNFKFSNFQLKSKVCSKLLKVLSKMCKKQELTTDTLTLVAILYRCQRSSIADLKTKVLELVKT